MTERTHPVLKKIKNQSKNFDFSFKYGIVIVSVSVFDGKSALKGSACALIFVDLLFVEMQL